MAKKDKQEQESAAPVAAGEAEAAAAGGGKAKREKGAGVKPAEDAAAAKSDAPRAEAKKPAAKKPEAAAGGEGGGKRERGRSARKPSKRYRKLLESKPDKPLEIKEAIAALKKMGGGVKFDQTVNIVMLLGIDPKQADQAIRGSVSLPHGIGKARKVVCFAEGDDADRARAAGAIEAGGDELIKKVSDGWMDFDVAIAHPRLMGKVGKLGRTLGPTGKMPSPKNGTVTAEIETAVREFAAGKVEFRNDTSGNVHGILGKISFAEPALAENASAFIDHIRRMKPATSKGIYIRKVCLSATMTPGIEVLVGA